MVSLSYMCWRKVITGSTIDLRDAYGGWPPVKIYPGGLDLEFAPLLLADKVFMDTLSFEQLTKETPVGLERAVSSLKTLHSNGYLELVDYTSKLGQVRERVLNATRSRLETPEQFLVPLRQAVKMWEDEGTKYAKVLNRPDDLIALTPVGLLAGAAADGARPTLESIRKVRRVLLKSKKLASSERDLLKEVARPYIDHAHTGIALYQNVNVGSAVIDWSDLGPIYESLLYLGIEPEKPIQKQIPKMRQLFAQGLSSFEPSNVDQFLRVMDDGKLGELRTFIAERAEKDDKKFDEQFVQETMFQIGRHHKIANRAGAIINAAGVGAGVIAACFDGGVTAGLLTTLGIGVGTQVAADKVVDLLTKDIKWFLCLVNGKGVI